MDSGSISSLRRLMTGAKTLGPSGKKLVKPPLFYDNAIMDDEITVKAKECRWVREVDGRKLFLLVMLWR